MDGIVRLSVRSSEFPLLLFREVNMRVRLATLTAATILIAGTSTVYANILCAVKLGYMKDMLRDRPGTICPVGERRVDPKVVGLQGPPGQNTAKGTPIYDCSVCAEGRLSLLNNCEFLEATGGFDPLGKGEVKTATKQCKLAGYLLSP
jgi:hypothetical protein